MPVVILPVVRVVVVTIVVVTWPVHGAYCTQYSTGQFNGITLTSLMDLCMVLILRSMHHFYHHEDSQALNEAWAGRSPIITGDQRGFDLRKAFGPSE